MAGNAAPTRIATVMVWLMLTVALAACGSSSSSTKASPSSASLAPACRAATAVDQTVTTTAHVFLLHVGSEERMVMLSRAEAKAKHIASGELMVAGAMSGGTSSGAMTGHMTMRHLEVHICERPSGKVVTGAMPAITVTSSSGGAPEQVPVVVMEGISAGAGDLHYGNNVALRPGATYAVTVRLGADRAAFKYTVASGM